MTIERLLPALAILPALWSGMGCQMESREPTAVSVAQTVSAAQTAPTTQEVHRECVRYAMPRDLELILFADNDPQHHFPVSTVKIYNSSADDVIVGYEPGSVVIHCGSYQQQGPAVTFVHRREILDPHEPLELAIPPNGWTHTNKAGERELMLPTDLPPGRYELWASFPVEGGGAVESRRQYYEVP